MSAYVFVCVLHCLENVPIDCIQVTLYVKLTLKSTGS